MGRKMIAAVIFVSALSGFLGGILANSLWKPAYSSPNDIVANTITAKKISILGSKKSGSTYINPGEMAINGPKGFGHVFIMPSSPLGSISVVAGSHEKEISPHRDLALITLFDSKNHLKLVQGLHGGQPYLVLNDPKGANRLILNVDTKGPGIRLLDKKATTRTSIGHIALQMVKTGDTEDTSESSVPKTEIDFRT